MPDPYDSVPQPLSPHRTRLTGEQLDAIQSSGIDLSVVWDEAGRPRGKSPRSWRRSTLGQAAVDFFAGRRGVRPESL